LPRSFPSRSEIPGFIREERSNDGGGGSRRKTAMPRHDRCRDRFPPALKYLVSSGKNVPMIRMTFLAREEPTAINQIQIHRKLRK
jgi:hypothetical protein